MRKLAAALAALGLAMFLLSILPGLTPGAGGAGTLAPPAAERGKALFVAKGCAACHVHGRVAGKTGEFSGAYGSEGTPNLTVYTNDPDFLRRWLRDPAAVKPRTTMPNLGLSDAEIAELIAFLNARP